MEQNANSDTVALSHRQWAPPAPADLLIRQYMCCTCDFNSQNRCALATKARSTTHSDAQFNISQVFSKCAMIFLYWLPTIENLPANSRNFETKSILPSSTWRSGMSQLVYQFDDLMAESGSLPGFRNFLTGPSKAELHSLAEGVVFKVSSLRSDTLLPHATYFVWFAFLCC